MTLTSGLTMEGQIAVQAEKYCPLCIDLQTCKLGTKGLRPRLDPEATETYRHPSYRWGECERLRKRNVQNQIKQQITDRFEDRTFESFGITKENKPAFDKCWNYAQTFTVNTKDGLILSGDFGTGKTHLASAILKTVLDKGIPGAMIVVPKLLEEIRHSYNDLAERRLASKVMQKRFLILDDLGAEKSTEWVREQLFNLINHRYENNLPTVITTNSNAAELKEKHGERIVDRLIEMCEGVSFTGPSYRKQIRKEKRVST